MYAELKRFFLGSPIASSEEHHQRLSKVVALPVFASDAISSTAYATQEILIVLVPAIGMSALDYITPLAVVVCLLLAVVITSYRQTIKAYPQGGGTYIVSRDNLGQMPSLVAGASILTDYVLTVAVSVSAGVAAITSAFPGMHEYRVLMCLGFILLMTLANLRGLKESGILFAPPTYAYVLVLGILILGGLYRVFFGDLEALPVNQESLDELIPAGTALGSLGILRLLQAFSSGAVALTGVEAVADGVPAFRRPEAKNAATTIVIMAGILGTAFLGLAVLATHLKPTVSEHETLLSIMGTAVFGHDTFLYFALQFSTFAILILAANTAYADFPRLCSIIARDEFLPHQFRNRGDRLVFSNGIVVLAVAACALVVGFGGDTSALIPLYAVGVFTGFTLSQFGMVRYQKAHPTQGWRRRQVVNAIGATTTGIVLIVVLVSKFRVGAWIPAALIPMIVLLFKAIGRHYEHVHEEMAVEPGWREPGRTHTVVVMVGSVNKGALRAIAYARSLAPDRLLAVSVVGDAEEQEKISRAWVDHKVPVELTTIYSPYRQLTRPILKFLDELDAESQDDTITVVVPEFVVTTWYAQLLHNHSALALKARLLFRPNTVVTSVPVVVGETTPLHSENASKP
ncbi:MAG: APC family permease [Acidimicrobiia bacterium]